ncbi:hypothetical protein COU62_01145 [Candidatus Pacearchaeota archaeon CG10_big_fil_rev_8_21_14_0_10_35_219]|nr:hypothetical protein [Candidatus Pacearchaeota archaeon]OIO43044.1 MAG: hypothetical protein AUJ63_01315 [Candidatus Pacearchaeota archaeon CG1_02_35_32]PIO08170.1 MAG: hypothetical protein COU62_01145 [Candidatus Pacearchaeota archaeon CG10_big_fil_rev_8_21_14_0_10_35_219]PIY81102.1 MAG: hypothetical protein COY79_04855 [Candidatus Pacearchaeota archaeon CG_4_10_14_0_8_um_filter_35_169]PIZ79751.1 MAG: hypothetical protein COY00_03390 [Candidatus Pacearchaeota archaeon CG_4_10_14_0_2_um_filt
MALEEERSDDEEFSHIPPQLVIGSNREKLHISYHYKLNSLFWRTISSNPGNLVQLIGNMVD